MATGSSGAQIINTGANNEATTASVVARNAIHHDAANASYIDLPVVR